MNATLSRLLAAMTYPRTVDDYVELAHPRHSSRHVRARVVDVRRETHDVATLVLEPNSLWAGHRAGQHVALTAEVRGVRKTRCFSIASAEGASTIEITVKAQPGGVVTPALVSGAMRGAIVELSRASGEFVLPRPADTIPDALLFLSGGSGITPVMSMLRTLAATKSSRRVTFVHYARTQADVIFRDELDRLAREAGPNVRIHVVLGPFEPHAFVSNLVPDVDLWDTWACGPEPMLAKVRGLFAARDAEARLRVERFSLGPRSLASDDVQPSESEVSFVGSRRIARGKGPLLAIAESAGLTPESGCRMGICHSCVCRKVSGVTRDLRTGELSTDANVDIQLCISEPVGPVEIDI